MRALRIIFGLIIFIVGLVFLGINTSLLPSDIWSNLAVFWPVLLILFGLAIIIRNIYLFLLIFILILVGVGLLIQKNPYNWLDKNNSKNEPSQSQVVLNEFNENIDTSTSSLNLSLDLGAANIDMEELDEDQSSLLLAGETGESLQLDKARTNDGSSAKIVLKERPLSDEFFNKPFSRRFLNLYLRPDLPTEIDINTGASKLDLDFSKIVLTKFSLNSGVSDVDIRFGNLSDNLSAEISSGASQLNFWVPKDLGIRVESKSAVSDNNFSQSGFVKNKNFYLSENFDSKSKKIDVKISSGVSKISVKQY